MQMLTKTIGLFLRDPELTSQILNEILKPAGFLTVFLDDEHSHGLQEGPGLDLVFIEAPELSEENLNPVGSFLEQNPGIPVILLSTTAPDSKQIEAFRLGVADCLVLPLRSEIVLEAVQSSLSRWGRIKTGKQPTQAEGETFTLENSVITEPSSQVEFETVLASARDGIIIIDEKGYFTFLNSSARRIFNLSNSDLIGQPLKNAITHPNFVEMIERISEQPFQGEEIALSNGKIYNTNLSSSSNSGTVIIMQDITHLKELDRIKSEFVATVSHDLRSPLTAILGYTELIDRVGSINDQQREFIQRIQFSTHNITNLISDLLDLGRIEAGFDAHKEEVSLTSIARYAVEGLRSRMEEKQQGIHLELEDPLPLILGNPIRLRQMAGNLIGNAVKYTPPGGQIWVRVTTGNGVLIFQVEDNGLGIPLQEQPFIFNKFYRGTNFPSETQGTGLGLAIVKTIAENHQGRIWVKSSPGKGSTFTVVLPVDEQL
jgi:PAS domain S-box-containing protein